MRLRSGLVHRVVGEEVFILMADSHVHWLKNPTAVAIWAVLTAAGASGASVGDIASALVRQFEVEMRDARQDVEAFLDTLRDRGVIERVTVSPSGAAPVGAD